MPSNMPPQWFIVVFLVGVHVINLQIFDISSGSFFDISIRLESDLLEEPSEQINSRMYY